MFPVSVCMRLLGFSKDNEMKTGPSVTAYPVPCAVKSFIIIQSLGSSPKPCKGEVVAPFPLKAPRSWRAHAACLRSPSQRAAAAGFEPRSVLIWSLSLHHLSLKCLQCTLSARDRPCPPWDTAKGWRAQRHQTFSLSSRGWVMRGLPGQLL